MTSENTVLRLMMTEPVAQLAIILGGVLLLWYVLHDIRKKISAASPVTDTQAAINHCNDLIGVWAKVIVGGMIAVLFGLCFLFAGGISAEFAFGLFTVLIFTVLIPAVVWFMFRGAPDRVLRWFLSDLG